jgi:hypothetical protein
MSDSDDNDEIFLTTADIDGHTYDVTVRIAFDGIEHVGHLWFRDADWDEDDGVYDRGSLPGRSPNEIADHARTLGAHELTLRYRRAITERRRYHGLRQVTHEVLNQIRYLNKVATSMRAGLLDLEEAAGEIAVTERRLHDMVDQLRTYAGVAT